MMCYIITSNYLIDFLLKILKDLDMKNLSKFLIKEFTEESSKTSIKFFRSYGAHGYIIWLTIISYYFEKKRLFIEDIIQISSSYASRRTVIDFINIGNEKGYLKKINAKDDKRKTLIIPSDITIEEYNEWSKYFVSNINIK